MGHTIQETTVTVFIGNYIRRVNVIEGSLYSRVYGRKIGPVGGIYTGQCHRMFDTPLNE